MDWKPGLVNRLIVVMSASIGAGHHGAGREITRRLTLLVGGMLARTGRLSIPVMAVVAVAVGGAP